MLPPIEFFVIIVLISALSGILGSLTGLGGATFLVPIYTLYLGVPIVYASGASLISTIATSSGAASAYIKDRITNVKIGMGLEIATTTGSISGALTVAYIYSHHLQFIVYIIFGSVLLSQVYIQLTKSKFELPKPIKPDWTTRVFQLYSSQQGP